MGNKLGRKRHVIDERYTRPQGLYVHKDVDIKKLRKLILESKLAPCYPGDEEVCNDLEECPICFLYYPSLNRSRCCMKGICTECFLQMKNPNSTRPTQCPFCKTSNYAVEYRGVKTKEEKGMEQIEEQRVIEAKIRMRQKELQDEEQRFQKRQESCSSNMNAAPVEVEYGSAAATSSSSPVEHGEIVPCQDSYAVMSVRQASRPRTSREDEFDVDLEDIMVMEAIWLSIQETGRSRNQAYGGHVACDQYLTEERYVSPSMAPVPPVSSSSPSGGLACAIAALAERQQMVGETSNSHDENTSFHTLVDSNNEADSDTYAHAETSGHVEWGQDHGSDAAEAGTSYVSSDAADDAADDEISAFQQPDEVTDSFQNLPPPIVPESFEEQMMLAMAVSLAEVRAMTSGPPGVSWH